MPFEPKLPEGPYIVDGLPLGDDGRPGIREELRTLSQSLVNEEDRVPLKTDQWQLYLLGLHEFQRLDSDKQLSYFQIAGIHGLPYEAWPKDDKQLIEMGGHGEKNGFCTHSSILFLSWHRPYLALFEYLVHEAMQYVANEFSKEGKDHYQAAVKNFRMPYWDWADMTLPAVPSEVLETTIKVPMPTSLAKEHGLTEKDGLVDMSNPLYSFRFPDGTPSEFKIGNLDSTIRYLVNLDLENPTILSPDERMKLIAEKTKEYTRNLPNLRPEKNLGERILYLMQSYQRYDHVSNNTWAKTNTVGSENDNDNVREGQGYGSLEDVHNTLHNLTGGGTRRSFANGHMARVAISAFDPIFWLHHTSVYPQAPSVTESTTLFKTHSDENRNIDRLTSIWQGLNDEVPLREEAWVTDKQSERGTFITAVDSIEGINTPLAPFYKPRNVEGQQEFWNSADVRSTKVFGYAYPETRDWDFKTTEEYQANIRQRLRDKIVTGSLANMIERRRAGDAEPENQLKQRAERLAQVLAVDEPATAATLMSLEASTLNRAGAEPGADFVSALPPIEVPNVELPTRSIVALAKHDELDRGGSDDDQDGNNDTYLEWLVNIKAAKYTLDGAYEVHVFLGPVEESDPTKYRLSPYHVGSFAPLGQSDDTSCGKCKVDQQTRLVITGQIPLTVALTERYLAGLIDDLDEPQVVAYLQTHLHWEVVDGNGRRLVGQRDRAEGLVVSVASNEVTIGRGVEKPARYSHLVKVYPEITTKSDPRLGGRAEGTGLTDCSMYA